MLKDKLIKDMDHEVWIDFTHWCAANNRKVSEALAGVLKSFLEKKSKQKN